MKQEVALLLHTEEEKDRGFPTSDEYFFVTWVTTFFKPHSQIPFSLKEHQEIRTLFSLTAPTDHFHLGPMFLLLLSVSTISRSRLKRRSLFPSFALQPLHPPTHVQTIHVQIQDAYTTFCRPFFDLICSLSRAFFLLFLLHPISH